MSEEDNKRDSSFLTAEQAMRNFTNALSNAGVSAGRAGRELSREIRRATSVFDDFSEATYSNPYVSGLWNEVTPTSATVDPYRVDNHLTRIDIEKNNLEDFCDRTRVDFRAALSAFTSLSELLKCRRDVLIKGAKDAIVRLSKALSPSSYPWNKNPDFWPKNPYAVIVAYKTPEISSLSYLGSTFLDQSILDSCDRDSFCLKVNIKTPEDQKKPEIRVIRVDNTKKNFKEEYKIIHFIRTHWIDMPVAHFNTYSSFPLLVLQPLEPVYLEEGKLFLRG